MVALPDATRRTTYNPVAATTSFAVGFVIYEVADSEDQDDEVRVYRNGVEQTSGWSLSASFTDGESASAVVLVDAPGWTGNVVIEGARRPRRTTQFQDGRGVTGTALNLAFNILTATLREVYDRTSVFTVNAYTGALDFGGNILRNIGEGSLAGDAMRKDQIEELVATVNAGGLAYSALLVTYSDDLTGLGGTVQAALDAAGVALAAAEDAVDDHETRITALEGGGEEGVVATVPIGATMEWDGVDAPVGWLFKYGQAISRSTYAALLNATTKTATATTTSGNDTLTSVSADLSDRGIVGSKIEGTGIPAGATILAVTSTTIQISANATASGTGVSIRIFPHGNGNGSTTFNIADDRDITVIGRGNMGGSARGLLSSSVTGGMNTAKLGSTGGEGAHTQTLAELVPHTHPLPQQVVLAQLGSGFQSFFPSTPVGYLAANPSGASATPFNVVQPGRVVNKIIYAGVAA